MTELTPEALASLKKLGIRRGGRVPFIQQLEAADCGAACLAMVIGYHGKVVSLDEARHAAGVSRGTDAHSILRGAAQLGLRGRGVRLEVEDLHYLPPGAILHWDLNHFVVLERLTRRTIDIIDPAVGRRSIPVAQFGKHFTGIALAFEPAEGFVATPAGRSKIWSYLGQLVSGQLGLVARILVTSVALRIVALGMPMLTAMIVDRVVPRQDYSLLAVVAAGIGVVLAFHVLGAIVRAYLLLELRTRLDTKMTFGFLAHLMSLPYAFFNRRSAGDLLMRVGSNAQIRDLMTSNLLSTLLDGTLAVVYLALLLLLSPTLAVITVGAGTLQLGLLLISRRRYAQLAAQDLETRARSQSYLVQMLVGIETLKMSGSEDRALEQWAGLYVDELNVGLARGRLMAAVDSITSLLQVAAPLLLLGVGAVLVLDGKLSLGTMLGTLALGTAFLAPLSNLLTSALQLQLLGSYVERIDDVLAAEPEQRRSGTVAPPRLTGQIEVRGVSFRYGPNDPFVVRHVDLAIEPGSTVAIVGRSGSGKSTLAALLLGLHRPSEGHILYDGYDLVELDHKRLRQQLGVVPQTPFMFGGSVRQNIALSDPSLPFDKVVAAARRAQIDTDIRAMPMSYETVIADGGASLSGGQRQRLALARALVHDPAVLLLDEATSSLDATTERAVMDNLRQLRATRIVIAHRLSTIVRADQIVVMQDGRIVEVGTHAELVRRRGIYSDLVADQTFQAEVPA